MQIGSLPTVDVGTRYRLLGVIERSAASEVLAARDERLGRDVVIRRLLHLSDDTIRQFAHEAMVLGRLDHPAVAPIYDVARDAKGFPFCATKLVAGTTFAELIAKAHRPRELARLFIEVCLAI